MSGSLQVTIKKKQFNYMQSSNSYLIFIKSTNLIHRLRCGPVQTATQERFELIKSRVYLSILINIIFFPSHLAIKTSFAAVA